MVWYLALCFDDAKQDPVVYSAEFGVVFLLMKGPRTASIQEGLDYLGLYHSSFEGFVLTIGSDKKQKRGAEKQVELQVPHT